MNKLILTIYIVFSALLAFAQPPTSLENTATQSPTNKNLKNTNGQWIQGKLVVNGAVYLNDDTFYVGTLAGGGLRMLTVSNTGIVGAQAIPVNTDEQTLSYDTSTQALTISGGNSVSLSALVVWERMDDSTIFTILNGDTFAVEIANIPFNGLGKSTIIGESHGTHILLSDNDIVRLNTPGGFFEFDSDTATVNGEDLMQTLSISNDTVFISGRNSIVLPFGAEQLWGRGTDTSAIYNINSGNVGIGTDEPIGGKLHVEGSVWVQSYSDSLNNQLRGFAADSSNGTILEVGSAAAFIQNNNAMSMLSVNADSSASLRGDSLWIEGSDKLVLNELSGNVGIGTAAPTEKLEVNGNVIADTLFGVTTHSQLENLSVAMSDEYSALPVASTSVPLVTIHAPYDITLTRAFAGLTTPGTGASNVVVDVHVNGSSIMSSTKILFSAGADTSASGVLTTTSIGAKDKIQFFLDQNDADSAATGLKCYLVGYHSIPGAYQNDHSLEFDGVNEYATAGDHHQYSFGNGGLDSACSGVFWVYRDTNVGSHCIVSKYGVANISLEYYFVLTGNTLAVAFGNSNAAGYIGRSYNAMSTTKQWIGLAFTYSGNKLSSGVKLYSLIGGTVTRIDNADWASGIYNGMTNTTAPLQFGRTVTGTWLFNGKIYAPQLYDIELSAAQLDEIADNPSQDASTYSFSGDLITSWHFPDGTADYPSWIGYGNDVFDCTLQNMSSGNIKGSKP